MSRLYGHCVVTCGDCGTTVTLWQDTARADLWRKGWRGNVSHHLCPACAR